MPEIRPEHPAFANAGQTPGIQIWRIENFEPVPRPSSDYGNFYTGDSYIILKTKENNGTLEWDLHFWLGTETSQDEAGAAAMYTVQLDDMLGGGPVQYRETQEHETQLFLSNFKTGIRYFPGGVASGFHHYDPAVTRRLFQVKGKKNIRVKQVELTANSLNNGDCFILEAGDDIFVYVGKKSKRLERIKAINVANLIRDQDHHGKAEITVIDEYCHEREAEKFFEVLGSGSPETIADASVGGDDEEFEQNEERIITLYKVSDADGQMKVIKVAQKPLKKEMLDSNDCFILDTERADLYVWIGKKCNNKEKSEAMNKAHNFLKTKQYPKFTRIQRVIDEGEPSIFRQYFSSWSAPKAAPTHVSNKDVLAAYHCKLVENGNLITYDIPDLEQEDLDEDDVTLVSTNSTIFVWCGKDSSTEERGASARKADRLKHCDQEHIKIIEQNQEPEEFIKLFPKWDSNFWNSAQSYEERRSAALKG